MSSMYYTVYKTTNILNGKFYIGKHMTRDLSDGYLGSGKILLKAIKKHGKQHFVKEILHVYDEEWKMNLAERILVIVDSEISYNLCAGGKGGWEYVHRNGIKGMKGKTHSDSTKQRLAEASLGKIISIEARAKISKANRENEDRKLKISVTMKNYVRTDKHRLALKEAIRKPLSLDHRKNLSAAKIGKGMNWITDGERNTKIPKNSDVPEGWVRGRTIKHFNFKTDI